MKKSTELACYKENDHWRVRIPTTSLYPRRIAQKHFETAKAAKKAIAELQEKRRQQEIDAARRWAKIVEVSEKEFLAFFNACPIPFPTKAIEQMMVGILTNHSTLVIRHK